MLQIALNSNTDTGSAANLVVTQSIQYKGKIRKSDMDDIVSSFYDATYATMQLAELRNFDGETIIYMEMVTRITNELIDTLIERNQLTEEMIEKRGGREALLATPPTSQNMVAALRSGYLYIYTGTYYNEEQKKEVLDVIRIAMQTTEPIT